MDPSTVISTITAAIGFARELKDVNKGLDEFLWKLKIAELTSALADAKMGAGELKDEIEARDREIARLKDAFAFKGQTIEHNNMTYEMQEGRPVGMPFCPRCLTVDGLYIRLVHLQKEGRPAKCPQCKSDYEHQSEWLPIDPRKR